MKVLEKYVSQVASVGVRDMLHLVTVNDDDRGIAATLMRVPKLDTPAPDQRRLVLLHR